MKKLFALFTAILFFIQVSVAQKSPYLVKTFEPVKQIKVNTHAGFIEVKGESALTEVKVYVIGTKINNKPDNENLEERLRNYDLSVEVVNGSLVCAARPKDSSAKGIFNELSFSFEISTPLNTDTDLITGAGRINLENLVGLHTFKTSGGALNLNNVSGKINGVTSGGMIQSNAGKGDFKLQTSGGSINVSNLQGDINLNTAGGSINLSHLNGNISAKTGGGSFGLKEITGDIKLNTGAGSINLRNIRGNLEALTGAGSISGNILSISDYLTLNTKAGSINLDIPFGEKMDVDLKGTRIRSKKLSEYYGNINSGTLKGKVNGGGKKVKIHTALGNISVD